MYNNDEEIDASGREEIRLATQQMMAKLYNQVQLVNFDEEKCVDYLNTILSAKYLCALVTYISNKGDYHRMVLDRQAVTLNGEDIGLHECDDNGLFDADGNYAVNATVSTGLGAKVLIGNNRFVIDTLRMPYNNFQGFDINDRTKLILAGVISAAKKLIVMPYANLGASTAAHQDLVNFVGETHPLTEDEQEEITAKCAKINRIIENIPEQQNLKQLTFKHGKLTNNSRSFLMQKLISAEEACQQVKLPDCLNPSFYQRNKSLIHKALVGSIISLGLGGLSLALLMTPAFSVGATTLALAHAKLFLALKIASGIVTSSGGVGTCASGGIIIYEEINPVDIQATILSNQAIGLIKYCYSFLETEIADHPEPRVASASNELLLESSREGINTVPLSQAQLLNETGMFAASSSTGRLRQRNTSTTKSQNQPQQNGVEMQLKRQ